MTKRSNTRPQAEQPTDVLATQRERAARLRDAAGRFSRRTAEATPEAQPVLPAPAAQPEAPAAQPPVVLGHVPRPANSHPGTYALKVVDDGLGLHAAPGSSILVEPVTPTGAGLAVFYSKHADGPGIFDLTHDFRPEFARPFAPGSEVMPLVEVIDPETGKPGRIRADKFDKIHRVIGVYTPADVGLDHRRAPAPLPVMRTCPEGMGTHRVEEAAAYPLVRPGETVVYDGMRREPTHGALCLLQWNNGTRSVLLTNQRPLGNSGDDSWCVDPVNRPPSRAAMDRRLQAGRVGTLYSSDGPYTADLLREKIVGTVVGILVPGRDPAPKDGPAIEAFALAPEVSTADAQAGAAPEAKADPVNEIYAAAIREREAAMLAAFDTEGLTSAVSSEMRAAVEAHHEALIACLPTHDMEFDAAVALEDAADEALRTAPVRSLADLRAKLTYLMPIIEPDMIDTTHAAHLKAIRADVDRLCRTPSAAGDEIIETDDEAQARIAAMPFEPGDLHGPCPVPSLEAWEHDGKAMLPWLRIGFLILSFDRDTLANHVASESEQHFTEFTEALGRAERNFGQLYSFAQAVQARRMIGLAILAENEVQQADQGGEA